MSYSTVWKEKQRVMKELFGDWGNTFRMLYNFRAELQLRSPGSVCEIDTYVQDDGKVFFSRFFMAMKPCLDGFKAECRPYLSIDSTALNEKWNGQLAAAIAIDGNNWMFPVAMGLFQSETEANWTWFMTQLYISLGHMNPLAICTDASKGLENAVKTVFPHAKRRECFVHLWFNLVKMFQGKVFGRMWPAARAYRQDTFKYHMDKMLSVSKGGCPEFRVYLKTYRSLLRYRSVFNTDIKVDHINNHLAESFKSWIRDLKDLPVHELVDNIRTRIINLFNISRQIGDKLHHYKLPTVVQQLVCKSRGLGHYHVVNASTN
ncbi:uncharacterized protein LOC104582142 [Brachypodium distachyon]|uniref:uncharacterized protein LOC104582142 n=1 Tax=Brachypodium distachyon TaxID=15368 RepID=UPI00052FDC15|nr:uncharacterized protein LOC104582142 [Brachypodium distachyon]|eukprot:XP_010229792.1 uncharacterized protein LOC104582142 [Brachypodium distachyon]